MSSPPRPAYDIAPGVLHREVEGEMVLLDLASERYFGLNEVGAAIVFRVTDEPWDDALGALAEVYDVDPAVLRADAEALVGELVEAGLLRRLGDA